MTVRGILYIISAPSGAGKTTLVQKLIDQYQNIKLSISYTTRAQRPPEADGKDYKFVSLEQFQMLQAQGAFIETAQVFGHYYGTAKNWLEDQLAAGFDVILEIDWQGARLVRALFACVSIFILPPSKAVLLARLKARGRDESGIIAKRMQEASNEMLHYSEYDYVIINDDLEVALADLSAIVRAGHSRTALQQVRYATLMSELIT